MTLEELVAELQKHPAKEVAAALQAHAGAVYQAVFGAGHRKATDEGRTKLKALEDQVAELTTEKDGLADQVKELEGKQPDLAKIREQHQNQITELKAKHKAELSAKDAQVTAERMDRWKGDLRLELVGLGADPEYAEVLVDKADTRKRMRPREGDSSLEALQADGVTPFAPGDGQSAVKLLAADLFKAVPAKFRTSTADQGAGTGAGNGAGAGAGGAGAGGSSGTGAKGKGAKLKEAILAERQAANQNQGPSAIDRLSGNLPKPAAKT